MLPVQPIPYGAYVRGKGTQGSVGDRGSFLKNTVDDENSRNFCSPLLPIPMTGDMLLKGSMGVHCADPKSNWDSCSS